MSDTQSCVPYPADRRAARAFLDSLPNMETSARRIKPSLTRVVALANRLGNPQSNYPAIHVTGTNGKGSTTLMAAELLRGRGLRVGTMTSPHLSSVRERIAVDATPVDDDLFWHGVSEVQRAAEVESVSPTWFETVTLAGYWIFAHARIDAAVVEVGMLGRWDATNILNAEVTVVTNVELDHMDVAGPTRAHIAREKAGIVKPGCTLILGERDPRLTPIFMEQHPSHVLLSGRDLLYRRQGGDASGSVIEVSTPHGALSNVCVPFPGEHQCDNAVLALGAVQSLCARPWSAAEMTAAMAQLRLPGRVEVLHSGSTVIIIDGAHNPAAGRALRRSLSELITARGPKILLCGVLKGRNPADFLTAVGAHDFDAVVATSPDSARSLPASALAASARQLGIQTVVEAELDSAVRRGVDLAGPTGTLLATGSLYLVSGVRAVTKNIDSNPVSVDACIR